MWFDGKFFRVILFLTTFPHCGNLLSSNSLLSRNFFQKCVRENSRNFHTVHCAHCTLNVDITEIPSRTILEKIRESNGFTKEIAKWLVWRKCFDESKFLFFSTRIHWKNISSKQLFSKYVTLTNFLPKKCERHSFTVWKNEKFSLTKKIFRQINSLVISIVKTLLSRNVCQKCVSRD